MKTYKKIQTPFDEIIELDEDGVITHIPQNPSNSMYQAYLASLEEQAPAEK